MPAADYQRIRDQLLALAEDPRPLGCVKPAGREGWRVRVGVYRIVYAIDDGERIVTVYNIGHRRDIYRR